MKKVKDEEEEGMISNKRPLKAKLAKNMQYGCFVKVHRCQNSRLGPCIGYKDQIIITAKGDMKPKPPCYLKPNSILVYIYVLILC